MTDDEIMEWIRGTRKGDPFARGMTLEDRQRVLKENIDRARLAARGGIMKIRRGADSYISELRRKFEETYGETAEAEELEEFVDAVWPDKSRTEGA
jgi:hypothetical protein